MVPNSTTRRPDAGTNEESPDQDEIDVGTEPPTPSVLLDLCNLPSTADSSERHRRLTIMKSFLQSQPIEMTTRMLTSRDCRDKKNGCLPLHWAAGTGYDEMIVLLLDGDSTGMQQQQQEQGKHDAPSVDQRAFHPSTDRTPLHYAARNGHLTTCRLLVERYGADPHPHCGRGSVTPLQLAVWQNRLHVVQYLVERNAYCGRHGVVHERNGFNCGLMHWVGLVPRKRWVGEAIVPRDGESSGNNDDDDDGSGVLPLARYLHSLGVSYDSTSANANAQGHTSMHKAAWGGNLPLIRYFRDEHGVYDAVQDEAGNYCADIAKMRRNHAVHQWLLEHGSVDRGKSYRILGLEAGASDETVRKRYMELARRRHPDKQHRLEDGEENSAASSSVDAFIRIKRAYEHLTKEGGVGKQKNPKFDEVKLLEDHRHISGDGNNKDSEGTQGTDDDLFMARLLAVLSDYGEDGFPVSLIARRWNQIWPDRPFPTPDEYVIERQAKHSGKDGEATRVVQKKVKLLKFLKWKCRDSSVQFQNVEGDALAFDKSFANNCSSVPNPIKQ